jgi:hypothetical protein
VVLLFIASFTCVNSLNASEEATMKELGREWGLWNSSADFCSLRFVNCTFGALTAL